MNLRAQAETIIRSAIGAVLPDAAVVRALTGVEFPGRVILVAAGKAAWQMAKAAKSCCRIDSGIVITKYGHVVNPLEGVDCREAGHPIPDENSFAATQAALELTDNLKETDTVLFLLSGGGSALFEKPLISGEELQDITAQLLSCGAEITEINTIRKRLSAVKGGKFAQHCADEQLRCTNAHTVRTHQADTEYLFSQRLPVAQKKRHCKFHQQERQQNGKGYDHDRQTD